MRYIGIDPGKLGGVSVIDDRDATNPDQLKTFDIPKIGNEIDVKALRDLFKELASEEHIFILEDVHAIPGAGAMQSFNFGQVLGIKKGLLLALDVKHDFVTPKNWQKIIWRGGQIQKKANGKNDTKAESMLSAQRWFPNTKFLKSKDGLIDAALIAMYAKITFGK